MLTVFCSDKLKFKTMSWCFCLLLILLDLAVDVPVHGGCVGRDVEIGAEQQQDARLVPGGLTGVAQAEGRVVRLRHLLMYQVY